MYWILRRAWEREALLCVRHWASLPHCHKIIHALTWDCHSSKRGMSSHRWALTTERNSVQKLFSIQSMLKVSNIKSRGSPTPWLKSDAVTLHLHRNDKNDLIVPVKNIILSRGVTVHHKMLIRMHVYRTNTACILNGYSTTKWKFCHCSLTPM